MERRCVEGKVEGGKFETNSFVSSSPQKEQVKKKTMLVREAEQGWNAVQHTGLD